MQDIANSAKIGSNVQIGKFVVIEDDVEIGDNTTIGNFSWIRKGAKIGKNCALKAYNEVRENVVIGDGSSFGSRCTLCSDTVIGRNVDVKYGFVTTTLDFKKNENLDAGTVGDNVLIGVNVTLMPGASIAEGAVVGGCSQVRANVGKDEVWYGSPAKFYKMRNEL